MVFEKKNHGHRYRFFKFRVWNYNYIIFFELLYIYQNSKSLTNDPKSVTLLFISKSQSRDLSEYTVFYGIDENGNVNFTDSMLSKNLQLSFQTYISPYPLSVKLRWSCTENFYCKKWIFRASGNFHYSGSSEKIV